MSEEDHDFRCHFEGERVSPECSCGWSGQPWDNLEDARSEWRDHAGPQSVEVR